MCCFLEIISQYYLKKCLQEEQEKTRRMSIDLERLEKEKQLINNDLQSLKGMRLYCLLEWYGKFVGENPIGKQMWKLMHKTFSVNNI